MKFCIYIDERCSPRDRQMSFGINRGFAEIEILKKKGEKKRKKKVKLALSLEPFGIFDKVLHTQYYWRDLDRGIAKTSPRNCKMTINVGRGCAEFQTLKQVAQRATIAHLSPKCQGQISFQKIRSHPSFNACSCYMKVSNRSNQNQQRKGGNTIFPIIRSMGVFLRRSRAANSVVGGPIWPKFELIHYIMHVLVTSKFEKDRININRDYVMTSIF